MKKTLSALAVLGILSTIGMTNANAFTWSKMNPFNWGKCNKCEKKVENCTCPTGYAAPCDPCEKKIPCEPYEKQISKPAPCDACDRLQQNMQNR
mgnify:CR=1 FL=1